MSAQCVTVLYVDSHAAVLSTTSAVLRQAGYTVLTADSTERAIRAIAYLHFDAVILDPAALRMTSVADALATFNPGAALMLLVNPWDAPHVADTVSATAMLPKPLPPDELLDELRSVLEQKKAPKQQSATA